MDPGIGSAPAGSVGESQGDGASESGMLDITDLMTECATELTMKEPFLCNKHSFLLQDAMAATQLMDRKMDSCEIPAKLAAPMSHTKKEYLFPRPAPESLSDPFVPLPWKDLSLAQTSIIVTHQLIRLQAMFSGASVGESIFTCLFAQRPLLMEMQQYFSNLCQNNDTAILDLDEELKMLAEKSSADPTVCAQFALFASSCCLLEIAQVFRSVVINADIYEEEDFVCNTHDLLFFAQDKITLRRHLDCVVETLKEMGDGVHVQRLRLALTFLNGLHFFLSSMGKLKRENIAATIESMSVLAKSLKTGLESIAQLVEVEGKAIMPSDEEDALVAQVFDSYVNRAEFGNTPVRKVSFLSPKESLSKLATVMDELDWSVCGLLTHGTSLAKIDRLLRRCSSVNILSRSLIVLNLYFDDLLLGQHQLQSLIVIQMQQLEHVPVELLQAPYAIAFLNRLAKPIYDTLKLNLSSRHRQRAYIEAALLREWTALQGDANIVDIQYRQEKNLDNNTPPFFGHYVLAVLLRLMDQHLTCGIEVGLFHGHDEICASFWYRDFLLAAVAQNLSLMRRGKEFYQKMATDAEKPPEPVQSRAKGKKKNNRNRSSNSGNASNKAPIIKPTLEEVEDSLELKLVEGKRLMSKGIVRFVVAIRKAGFFKFPDYDFTSRQAIFENRFAVFASVRHPPALSYQDYLDGSDSTGVTVKDLCMAATEAFKSCRQLVEALLREIGQCSLPYAPVQEQEARSLLKVCVGNSVYVLKLLQLATSEDQPDKVRVDFDYDAHKEFCILKIS